MKWWPWWRDPAAVVFVALAGYAVWILASGGGWRLSVLLVCIAYGAYTMGKLRTYEMARAEVARMRESFDNEQEAVRLALKSLASTVAVLGRRMDQGVAPEDGGRMLIEVADELLACIKNPDDSQ